MKGTNWCAIYYDYDLLFCYSVSFLLAALGPNFIRAYPFCIFNITTRACEAI